MAANPRSPTQFTRESAERIARVVRSAELATPAGVPLKFSKQIADRMPKQVRAATFTGSWPIGSTKVVTFKQQPIATASVTNLSWPITHNHASPEDCVVGKEGTSWWLIAPVLQTATAVFCSLTVEQSVITGVSVSGALNPNSCELEINVSTQSDSIVTMSGTTTAAYLSLRVPA